MGWVDSLRGCKVGIDTTPIIYFTEGNPAYLEVLDPFFETLGNGEITVITSIVTLNDRRLPSLPGLQTLVLDNLMKNSDDLKEVSNDQKKDS